MWMVMKDRIEQRSRPLVWLGFETGEDTPSGFSWFNWAAEEGRAPRTAILSSAPLFHKILIYNEKMAEPEGFEPSIRLYNRITV
jgi:hypothetical protein